MLYQDTVRHKKTAILILGTLLSFFTSMSKILVPGVIFNNLQAELSMTAAEAALIGAVYMYCYAGGQFMMGIFSDRYGGVRLLLIGSSCFAAGMIVFPFLSHVWLMSLARGICAIGAGTVFLGVAKLVNDLFPKKFGLILGFIMLCSYLGPATGIFPIDWLVRHTSWRIAMGVPAVISLVLTIAIVLLSPGTVRRTLPGNSFHALLVLCRKYENWLLFFSAALIFGVYYSLLMFAGKKVLEDFNGLSSFAASLWMTGFALLVAVNNVLVNPVLKLLGGRRLMLSSAAMFMAGCLLGIICFRYHLSAQYVLLSFFLIAVPAGFFSGYSDIARKQNPEQVGLAVSMLNCLCFVLIAGTSHLTGKIMDCYRKDAEWIGTAWIYPASAYRAIFIFFFLLSVISVLCAVLLPVRSKRD